MFTLHTIHADLRVSRSPREDAVSSVSMLISASSLGGKPITRTDITSASPLLRKKIFWLDLSRLMIHMGCEQAKENKNAL